MKKYLPIALALSLSINMLTNTPATYGQYNYNTEANYSKYFDSGIQYYNNSEFSKAIEQFTQALKLAPRKAEIRNNLAVSYISRGTYYHNKIKKYDSATDNYRDAIYYLKYDQPDNAQTSPNASGNLDIAEKNLSMALLGLKITESPSFHFKKAKELRAKGMFRGAIVEYYQALKKSPPNAEAYEAIGDMYRVLQNYNRAVKSYEKAIGINKNNAQLFAKVGLAYEKANKLNSAIKSFNEASQIDPNNHDALNALEKIWVQQIKLNPRNAAAHANLGTILQKKGDLDGALEQYNAAERIDPANKLVRLNLGTLYQAKGDINTAIKAYNTILSVDPKNVLAHYYKATALRQAKNYVAATQELNIVLQIDPTNNMAKHTLTEIAKEQAGGSNNLVNVLKDIADKEPSNAKAQYDAAYEAHSKGKLETAIRYYRKAINLDPNMTDAYSNLGVALKATKQYNDALNTLQEAAKLDSSNEEVKKLIAEIKELQVSNKYEEALALHQEGKVDNAIKLYEEALASDPNNADIHTNLGAAHQKNQNYDTAIKNYSKALDINPNSAVIYYYMGTAYHAKGQIKDAIAKYNKSLELDPTSEQVKESLKLAQTSEVDNILSDALNAYNNKSYDRAKTIINDALKLDPNNAQGFYYLGLVMDAKNDVSSAINNYQKATQLDPKMENAYYALAIALDKTNDKPRAKEAFQKYIQVAGNKDDAFVKYAKDRLKQLQ